MQVTRAVRRTWVEYLQAQSLERKGASADGTLGAERRAHRRRGQLGVSVRRSAASRQPAATAAAATERRLRPRAHTQTHSLSACISMRPCPLPQPVWVR